MEHHRRLNSHQILTTHNHHRYTFKKKHINQKNDLAVVTEKKALTKPQIIEQTPSLIHIVPCKTGGEYKRKQEKIKKFCLEETKQQKAQQHPKSRPTGRQRRLIS